MYPYDGLANRWFQPLTHVSGSQRRGRGYSEGSRGRQGAVAAIFRCAGEARSPVHVLTLALIRADRRLIALPAMQSPCPPAPPPAKARPAMLTNLAQQPADALLALIKLHHNDPRVDKIDLGVGVYKTGQGDTPVFGAIKAAEKILVETQVSKAYLGPEGDMAFVEALMPYVFGKANPSMDGRIEGMQTPGGTGSLRLALALIKKAGIKRAWMGVPSWPNHAQICADLGLELKTFSHAAADGSADMASLRAAIAEAEEGDAFLLHGCCHNPTGIDYSNADWDEIAELGAGKKLL